MPKNDPKILQHVKKFDPASLPPWQAVMKQNSSKSIVWPIYGSMSIWTTLHAGNFSRCGWLCSMKMMDLLVTTMSLMMNAWHLLMMKVNKIEGRLTHAMNAPINIIWWLNISQCSMWWSNSSFNLFIRAACHMQPWVSSSTFPIILSIYLLINATLLACTTNKEWLKMY